MSLPWIRILAKNMPDEMKWTKFGTDDFCQPPDDEFYLFSSQQYLIAVSDCQFGKVYKTVSGL